MNSRIEKQVLDHYRTHWGMPVASTRFVVDEPLGTLDVLEFHVGGADGTHIYATVGMCRAAMKLKHDEQVADEVRTELFVYADQEHDELREVLAGLAAYPFEHDTHLGIGHLIPGTHGVVSASPLTDILFSPALMEADEFHSLHLNGLHHVTLLWVVPIHRAERIFARQNGWRALVSLFSAHEVEPTSFDRASVV